MKSRILFLALMIAASTVVHSDGTQVYTLQLAEYATEAQANALMETMSARGYQPVFSMSLPNRESDVLPWKVFGGVFDTEIEAWAIQHLIEAKGEVKGSKVRRIEGYSGDRTENRLPYEKPFNFSQLAMPFDDAEYAVKSVTLNVKPPEEKASELTLEPVYSEMLPSQLEDRAAYSMDARDVVQAATTFLQRYPSNPGATAARQNLIRGAALWYRGSLGGAPWIPPSMTDAEIDLAARALLADSSQEVRSKTRKLMYYLKRWQKDREECAGKEWNTKWGWRGIERGRLRLEYQTDALAEADNTDNTALDRLELAMTAAYHGSLLHQISREAVLSSTYSIDLGSSLSWYTFDSIARTSQVPEKIRAECGLMRVGMTFELFLAGVVGNATETAEIAADYLSALDVTPLSRISSDWPDWKKYDVVRAKLQWGETHWKAERPLEAIPVFTSIIDSSPEVGVLEYSTALKMRALCNIKSGSNEAAIEDYENLFAHAGTTYQSYVDKRVMLNTTIPESLYRCAQACSRTGQGKRCLELCDIMEREWNYDWNPWLPWALSLKKEITTSQTDEGQ